MARPVARGMTLVEVLVSMAILSVTTLALAAGMIVAFVSNAYSAKRTQMSSFAQSRLERMVTQTRSRVCISSTTTPIDCSPMTVSSGAFNPNSAPGTGGWMLDVIDGIPNGAAGDDVMFGPIVQMGDASSIDAAKSVAARTVLLNSWFTDGKREGCASAQVKANSAILCREVHVEPFSSVASGVNPAVPMLHVWIRVIRGGTGDPLIGAVTLEGVLSQ